MSLFKLSQIPSPRFSSASQLHSPIRKANRESSGGALGLSPILPFSSFHGSRILLRSLQHGSCKELWAPRRLGLD